jgi:hypothetical protein
MLKARPIEVPGNASRYFTDRGMAMRQPHGLLGLARSTDGHVHNALFRPELVRYDEHYRTTSCDLAHGQDWLPTLAYLPDILDHLPDRPSVCDIGCGQGELVHALRQRGIDARGFDPVLRRPSQGLYAAYWTPDHPDGDADLLIMRCVLPHIEEPWSFLGMLATRRRHVLVEYQRIEWLIEHGVWYGMHHDHVNYFLRSDFERTCEVVDEGVFADGEWGWVLLELDPSKSGPLGNGTGSTNVGSSEVDALWQGIEELDRFRTHSINRYRDDGRPIILWGAAGKGIVAADALTRSGVEVLAAADADRAKWGLFLECSGTRVWSPDRVRGSLASGPRAIVAVSNPRHLSDVTRALGATVSVESLATTG